MKTHTEINNKLYDYCVGDLVPSDHLEVEKHLSMCTRCSNDLKEIESSVRLIGKHAALPSSAQPEEYWLRFSLKVDEKIRHLPNTRKSAFDSLRDWVQSYFIFNRGAVIAAGAACVVIVCALVLWKVIATEQKQQEFAQSMNEAKPPVETITPVVNTNERLGNYFRKSKTLLVGIANMNTEAGDPIDLSFERQTSRSLIKEARFLQNQNIDGRSARLIEDLNKILVELANLEEQHNVPDVELIRGGIHQENLLFKIRMAEVRYDSSSLKEQHIF